MTAVSRRRFLAIAAATAACAALPRTGRSAAAPPLTEWHGVALGAEAHILLHHPDPAAARGLIAASLAEIGRLEAIFSLFRPDSALSRLNRDGVLEQPPMELLALLSQSLDFSRLTNGAFDVTVQPLWRLYADHFSAADADPAGPGTEAIGQARALVDYRAVILEAEAIRLARPGMGVTLNGIAQGYVTDRIADMLRRAGLVHVLAHLGESRALGPRPDGRPWSVGIEDPEVDGRLLATTGLSEGAMATSGGYGCRFSPLCHHIFDPATGRSANGLRSVTVTAPTATQADALSTSLAVLPPARHAALLAAVPGSAVVSLVR